MILVLLWFAISFLIAVVLVHAHEYFLAIWLSGNIFLNKNAVLSEALSGKLCSTKNAENKHSAFITRCSFVSTTKESFWFFVVHHALSMCFFEPICFVTSDFLPCEKVKSKLHAVHLVYKFPKDEEVMYGISVNHFWNDDAYFGFFVAIIEDKTWLLNEKMAYHYNDMPWSRTIVF